MQPGLQDGDRLIVIKPVYTFTSPQRGEIVIIHPPVAPDKEWVKRVIGIPGDTIEIKNGTVYVNNVALDEPYIKAKPAYPRYGPIQVPPDNYFVLGDNRNNSTDSHTGWTVSRQNVVGEVWLRIWPFSNWGIVRGYPLSQELQSSAQNQTSLLTGSLIWP
jgi:signal peptidase I